MGGPIGHTKSGSMISMKRRFPEMISMKRMFCWRQRAFYLPFNLVFYNSFMCDLDPCSYFHFLRFFHVQERTGVEKAVIWIQLHDQCHDMSRGLVGLPNNAGETLDL